MQRAICCRIITPAQPVYPAASVRDYCSGAYRSSEVMRRHPPHHLSPAQAITRQGQTPKRALAAPSYDSNAPIKPESQSILSKIVAHCSPHPVMLMAAVGGECGATNTTRHQ